MPQRLAFLQHLNQLAFPFLVTMPMSDAVQVHGLTASALSWVPGLVHGPGSGDLDE